MPRKTRSVQVNVRMSAAEKARLVASGTPQNQAYVKLPNFITVTGTLGDPKAHLDKAALAGTFLERYGSKIPGVNEKTGGLLQGLGGVLSGGKSGGTNQPPNATNQPPATNKSAPLNNLLDLLKKPKK